nr:hypothetical protein [Mycoplasmopsis bovis]
MKFGSIGSIYYENIGKISGKTKEYLENDYESCSLLQKISYFKPWCWDVDTDILTTIKN